MERCHKFSYPMRRRPGRHPGWQQFLSEMWQKTPYEEGTEVRGVGAGGDLQDDALEGGLWADDGHGTQGRVGLSADGSAGGKRKPLRVSGRLAAP